MQHTDQRSKAGRARFGLKAALLAMLVLAIPLAWFGSWVRQAQKQDAALEQIARLSSSFRYSYTSGELANQHGGIDAAGALVAGKSNGPADAGFFGKYFRVVREISLEDAGSDEVLSVLPTFTELEWLNLYGSENITPDGIRQLRALRNLRFLELSEVSGVTDASLVAIGALVRLEELFLNRTETGDQGIAALSGLANLRYLALSETPITDAGLKTVASCSKLTGLELRDTQISDEGIAHLVALGGLRELDLYGTSASDSGISSLQKLSRLETLDLGGTKLTDDGLAMLATFSSLKTIDVRWTAVTKQALDKFRSSRPDVKLLANEP